jgi:hypothetical protein
MIYRFFSPTFVLFFFIVGFLLGIWCMYDLFTKKNIEPTWKFLLSLLILYTSWIGDLVYLIFARKEMPNKQS